MNFEENSKIANEWWDEHATSAQKSFMDAMMLTNPPPMFPIALKAVLCSAYTQGHIDGMGDALRVFEETVKS